MSFRKPNLYVLSPPRATFKYVPGGTRPLVTSVQEAENTNVGHARFIAEASKHDKWKNSAKTDGVDEGNGGDFDSLTEGKGASPLR